MFERVGFILGMIASLITSLTVIWVFVGKALKPLKEVLEEHKKLVDSNVNLSADLKKTSHDLQNHLNKSMVQEKALSHLLFLRLRRDIEFFEKVGCISHSDFENSEIIYFLIKELGVNGKADLLRDRYRLLEKVSREKYETERVAKGVDQIDTFTP